MSDEINESASAEGTFHDFQAIHDHQPGAGMELRVTGEMEYPVDCYTVGLERMRSGINPKILMLRLNETTGDVCLEKITREPVRWVESTEFEYDSVQILPGGPSLEVQCVY